MVGNSLFTLSVLFSVIMGTAAGVLSLLTLEILRRSPFGRAVFALSIVMAFFVVYHATLIIAPGTTMLAKTGESSLYTGFAAFVWTMVWSQYRMRRRTETEVNA